MRWVGMTAGAAIVALIAAVPCESASVAIETSIPEIESGITIIENDVEGGGFGWYVRSLGDINGDGRSELVVGSAGASDNPSQPLSTQFGDGPGRVYVISSAPDFLGPLVAGSFAPTGSNLAGGMRLTLRGSGFDAGTAVFLGDTALEILERPDSKTIVARIPPSAVGVSLPVKATRGAQTAVFPGEFTYFGSVFPFELELKDLGTRGIGLLDSQLGPPVPGTRYFQKMAGYVAGSGDFTGDGKADVVCALESSNDDRSRPLPGRVFLIHGAESLPATLTTDAIAPYATILTSAEPRDYFGDSASLVGDMNGDGACELAVAAPLAGKVYVLFGGEIPKGEVVMQTLIEAGRGFVIEGCPVLGGPYPSAGFSITLLGDVNGDGLADFGLVTVRAPSLGDQDPGQRGALVVVVGIAHPAAVAAHGNLPRIDAPTPPWGGDDVSLPDVRGVGDVDGDGLNDVYLRVSAHSPWPEYLEDERAILFFGRRAIEGVMPLDDELASGGAVEFLDLPSEWYGSPVVGAGDQNGDGRDDLAIKAESYVDCGPDCCTPNGRPPRDCLRILYGRSRAELAARKDISVESDFDATFSQADDSTQWLRVFDSRGDLDADGRPDLLLIQRRYYGDKGLPDRAIALFGGDLERKAGIVNSVRETSQILDYSPDTGSGFYGDAFGSYQFAGDVNGDGYEDTVLRTEATLWIYLNPLGTIKYGRSFVRGDANQDGKIDIADAISTLTFLFAHGRVLPCMDAGDANDDEQLNIADAIRTLSFLFGSGVKPPLPPPNECGADPQGDTLDCRESPCP